MRTDKYKAKRIRNGFYIYRGYEIHCIGYYQPEHRIVWEAVDEDGCGFAHSYSLRDTKIFIDEEINRIKKMKEHKIGEIFEHNGEWYQRVEGDSCGECSLFTTECRSGTKNDLADKVFGECSKNKKVGQQTCYLQET